MSEKLNARIVEIVEEFDLDFNLANALFALINSNYTEKPVEDLTRANALINRRIDVVTRQLNNQTFVQKKFNGGQ